MNQDGNLTRLYEDFFLATKHHQNLILHPKFLRLDVFNEESIEFNSAFEQNISILNKLIQNLQGFIERNQKLLSCLNRYAECKSSEALGDNDVTIDSLIHVFI